MQDGIFIASEHVPIQNDETTYPDWMDDALRRSLYTGGYSIDAQGLLAYHTATKAALAVLKEQEMELRKAVVKAFVPDPKEGMNTVALDDGLALKAQVPFNYNLKSNKEVEDGLDRISKMGNEGGAIADRLVSWKPSFLLTEYRQLQEDKRNGSKFAASVLKEIESFLVITDGAPTVEIKPDKKASKK